MHCIFHSGKGYLNRMANPTNKWNSSRFTFCVFIHSLHFFYLLYFYFYVIFCVYVLCCCDGSVYMPNIIKIKFEYFSSTETVYLRLIHHVTAFGIFDWGKNVFSSWFKKEIGIYTTDYWHIYFLSCFWFYCKKENPPLYHPVSVRNM